VGTNKISPANGFQQGASPCGALQMVWNVWEFVEQTTKPDKAEIRGGSFTEPFDKLRDRVIWDSKTLPGDSKSLNLGFRCVRDAR
jgi:formylglycine-generating enzyme required for sulfatase activity